MNEINELKEKINFLEKEIEKLKTAKTRRSRKPLTISDVLTMDPSLEDCISGCILNALKGSKVVSYATSKNLELEFNKRGWKVLHKGDFENPETLYKEMTERTYRAIKIALCTLQATHPEGNLFYENVISLSDILKADDYIQYFPADLLIPAMQETRLVKDCTYENLKKEFEKRNWTYTKDFKMPLKTIEPAVYSSREMLVNTVKYFVFNAIDHKVKGKL